MDAHKKRILEQFGAQAELFATAPPIRNEDALRLLVQFSGAGPRDRVLDVACGAGPVICAFAAASGSAVGIDLTPAMVRRARQLQAEQGIRNAAWLVGDVEALPFRDAAFDVAVTRYAMHHFPDPRRVFEEMRRVCAPGGRLVIADVIASADPGRAAAFNLMERRRDPSHVRAWTLEELRSLFRGAGLGEPREAFHRLEFEMEMLLQGSRPQGGDADAVRRMFRESLQQDGMGLGAREIEGRIHFAYPIALLASEQPPAHDGR